MNTPIIIITQSYIDEDRLTHLVCEGYFNDTIENQLRNTPKEFEDFTKHESQGRIIQLHFDAKKDLRESIFNLQQVYPEKTLLFLGNIDSYSIALQEGLLKLLEEPPHNLQIIMFSNKSSTLLPTIQSRSRLIPLSIKLVLALLSEEKVEKVAKKLPKPSEFTKLMITNSVDVKSLSTIDFAKLERDEIDFWLWQVLMNLNHVYVQNPRKSIAQGINKVLNSQISNEKNTQKKFVFYNLLSQ